MSANERGLLAMLFGSEPSTAEVACRRVMTLFADNSRMSDHELRVYEIVMEGLGIPAPQRRAQLQAAIQLKRDRLTAMYAERIGRRHETP